MVRTSQVRSGGQNKIGQECLEVVRTGQGWSGMVRSGLVRYGPDRIGQVWSNQDRSGLFRTDLW